MVTIALRRESLGGISRPACSAGQGSRRGTSAGHGGSKSASKTGGEDGLRSLKSTLDKLGQDEDRHQHIVEEIARSLALPQRRIDHHAVRSFSESEYVFVKTIGQGRFGTIKLGKKKANQTIKSIAQKNITSRVLPKLSRSMSTVDSPFVAVRIIPRFRATSSRVVKNDAMCTMESHSTLLRSITALQTLDHPNICRVYESFEDLHHIYTIMELYTGKDLFTGVDEPLSERNVAGLISQVLGAMASAHEHSVVHQDLRPENLRYATEDDDARLVVTDWDLAEFIHTPASFSRSAVVYTEYTAPEAQPGSRSDKVDVWSIGVIAFALLTFDFPFAGAAQGAGAEGVDAELGGVQWGPTGAQLSAPCQDFIRTMLRREPRDRPSCRAAMRHPWFSHVSATECSVGLALNRDTARAIMKFRSHSLVHRQAATFASNHLSGQVLHDLTMIFKRLDTDNNGTIDRSELEAALRELQRDAPKPDGQDDVGNCVNEVLSSPAELSAMFGVMDTDGNGKVSYSEFLSAASDTYMQDSVYLIWEAFRAFDVDQNGKISLLNLEALMQHTAVWDVTDVAQRARGKIRRTKTKEDIVIALGLVGGSPENAKEVMDRMDLDGDGTITFDEFLQALQED